MQAVGAECCTGLPACVVERFEIVRQIGKGAYGLVYQANDKKTYLYIHQVYVYIHETSVYV